MWEENDKQGYINANNSLTGQISNGRFSEIIKELQQLCQEQIAQDHV